MKQFLLKIMLYIARTGMRFIYFFIKLFTKQKTNKITMLSRQSNNINIDFRLLKEELEKNDNIEIKILCKMIPDSLPGKIKYCFYTLKNMYHIATSKVCIIDGYNIPISSLKHKEGLEVVQVWHAMGAIKKFGYQVLDKGEGSNSKVAEIMNMHANYTCVTCTSKATRIIYSEAFNTDLDKIQVLGMPRIDYLLGRNDEINYKGYEIIKEYPKLNGKINILYVPTFRKNAKINLENLINNIDENKYNFIVRLHPLDKTEVDEKYKIDSKYSTMDLLKIADYVITDYSAIAFEALVLDKPVYFYLYDIDKYNELRGLNMDLFKEMKNSTKTDFKDIINSIENNEYDFEELKQFKNRYVETSDNKNTERIVNYILNVIENNI